MTTDVKENVFCVIFHEIFQFSKTFFKYFILPGGRYCITVQESNTQSSAINTVNASMTVKATMIILCVT